MLKNKKGISVFLAVIMMIAILTAGCAGDKGKSSEQDPGVIAQTDKQNGNGGIHRQASGNQWISYF